MELSEAQKVNDLLSWYICKDSTFVDKKVGFVQGLAPYAVCVNANSVKCQPAEDVKVYRSSFFSLLKAWALTLSLGGAQFCFTSILSYGRPQLQSLGFSDEMSIAILLLIPVFGLICQPVIGAYSDGCSTKIGSRTPFLIGTFVLTAASTLAFSFSVEIARVIAFGSLLNNARLIRIIAKIVTMLAIIGSGIAQDANTACTRSLLVDKVPFSQQTVTNAIAAVSAALGGLSSYIVCSVDLVAIFRGTKYTQMHIVGFISVIVLALSIGITVIVAKEGPSAPIPKKKWYEPLVEIVHTIKNIPPSIRTLCNIQFFSSLPWYPILFFSSTWVEENTISPSSIHDGTAEEQMSNARRSTIPLIIFSLASLVSGIILPYIIPLRPKVLTEGQDTRSLKCYFRKVVRHFLSSTAAVWGYSHVFLFLIVCFAPIKMGFYSCLVILAVIGYNWGIVQWVPFALLSELLLKLKNKPALGSNLEGKVTETTSLDSGAVLGVHNIYIVLPQLLSAFASLWITYTIDNHYKGQLSNSAGWCMFLCSWGALVAAYMIFKKIPKLEREFGLGEYSQRKLANIICTYSPAK